MKKIVTPDVEAIGQMNFNGNIIPHTWYNYITKNGKANVWAILILADICYWYRPTVELDEYTGNIKVVKKKFASDLLQKSYESYAKKFGISKSYVKEAIVFLEELGLIKRVFRNIKTSEGLQLLNVMYLQIFPEALKKTLEYKDVIVEDIRAESDELSETTVSDAGVDWLTTEPFENIDDTKKIAYPTPGQRLLNTQVSDITENTTKTTTENKYIPYGSQSENGSDKLELAVGGGSAKGATYLYRGSYKTKPEICEILRECMIAPFERWCRLSGKACNDLTRAQFAKLAEAAMFDFRRQMVGLGKKQYEDWEVVILDLGDALENYLDKVQMEKEERGGKTPYMYEYNAFFGKGKKYLDYLSYLSADEREADDIDYE